MASARRRGVTAAMTTVLAGVLVAACSSTTPGATPRATTTVPATGSGVARTDAAGTVWLCRPGLADDPCAGNLDATSVSADGSTLRQPAQPATTSRFDCFYVYPTVSRQSTDNADLTVQAPEIGAAVAQAARFSQVCRVWAPMYRQRTEDSLAKGLGGDPTADATAYASLLAGWRDYLAHDNDGRPIIFLGHSQGAAMLIRLLRSQIDPDPSLRKLLVSAIILGGNVEVATGRDVGGSFQNIPACTSVRQTGCVIAYSSYLSAPPRGSLFGRPGAGVSLQSDQTATSGVHVLCTNPANLAGGPGPLDPYFLSSTSTVPGVSVATPWVTYPGLYSAQCQSAAGATWLEVDDLGRSGDQRPRVSEALGPQWGLHLDDVNLALGNLVEIVSEQEAAYGSARGPASGAVGAHGRFGHGHGPAPGGGRAVGGVDHHVGPQGLCEVGAGGASADHGVEEGLVGIDRRQTGAPDALAQLAPREGARVAAGARPTHRAPPVVGVDGAPEVLAHHLDVP